MPAGPVVRLLRCWLETNIFTVISNTCPAVYFWHFAILSHASLFIPLLFLILANLALVKLVSGLMFWEQSSQSMTAAKTQRKSLLSKSASQCGKSWQQFVMWVQTYSERSLITKYVKRQKSVRQRSFVASGDERTGIQGSQENDSDHPRHVRERWKSVHPSEKCMLKIFFKKKNLWWCWLCVIH